jgi:hypothetical protein
MRCKVSKCICLVSLANDHIVVERALGLFCVGPQPDPEELPAPAPGTIMVVNQQRITAQFDFTGWMLSDLTCTLRPPECLQRPHLSGKADQAQSWR